MFLVTNLDFEQKSNNSEAGTTVAIQSPVLASTKVIVQDQKSYIPAGVVAKEFDYALSHVSLLARQKKIDATWVGKRWFVNRDSVVEYRNTAQRNKVAGGLKSQNIVLSSSPEEHLSQRANLRMAALCFFTSGLLLFIFLFNLGILKFDAGVAWTKFEKGKEQAADILEPYKYITASLWSDVSDFFDWLFSDQDAKTYITIEEYNRLQDKIAGLEAGQISKSEFLISKQSQNPNVKNTETKIINSIIPSVSASSVNLNTLIIDLDALEQRVNTLTSNFDSFSKQVPTTYILPETNTKGHLGRRSVDADAVVGGVDLEDRGVDIEVIV